MSEKTEKKTPRFPVFHVPHDGRLLKVRLGMFCIPEEQVRYYHNQMRDKHVRDLIPPEYNNPESTVRFPFSRLQCDVERYWGPEEIMEKYGMGVSYSRVYDGTVINRHPWTRWEILRQYGIHHNRVNHCCARERAFLIDLHSYHDRIILPDFRIPGRETPDLCIGTDPRFTPPELLRLVRERFEEAGLTTDVNYPYAGCYIPERIAEETGGSDFIAVMLEFHRRAYLDEEERTDPVKRDRIREVIRRIVADSSEIG